MNTGKITSKQSMIMLLIVIYPIILWAMPSIFASESKQAGWLTPIPAFFLILFFIKQLNYLIIQNPNLSLMECFEKSTNKIIAKLYGIILLIFLFYSIIQYIRYVSEQITSSIYPNVQEDIFVISLLIIVNLILQSNITILARMGEMFLFFLVGAILILIILLLPNISIAKITPISYIDIISIIKPSIGYSQMITPFYLYILIFSDCIINKKNLMKYSKKMLIFIVITQILLLIEAIGTFGFYFLQNTSWSYLTLMKYLQIGNFLVGFESLIIIVWVISEFISVSFLIFSFIKLLQYLFNIKHIKKFINISLVLFFVFSKLIGKNIDIMLNFRQQLEYTRLFIEFIIPMFMVCIYRVRFRKKE